VARGGTGATEQKRTVDEKVFEGPDVDHESLPDRVEGVGSPREEPGEVVHETRFEAESGQLGDAGSTILRGMDGGSSRSAITATSAEEKIPQDHDVDDSSVPDGMAGERSASKEP